MTQKAILSILALRARGEERTSLCRLAQGPMNETLPAKHKGGAPIGNRNAARLSPKVKAVVDILLTDPDISIWAACKQAQCSRTTFYKAERSETYAQYLQSLSRTRLRTRIVTSALHRYEGLIARGQSEYVVADLSKDALAQAGVRETVDRTHRPAGIGSITIHIGPRPGETVRIDTQPVVIDGTATRPEDERTD